MGNKADKLLFTPGPLTTSGTVKSAMLRDLGSRDNAFLEKIASIRAKLLSIANVSAAAGYTSIIIQGSGTFGIEAVISSAIPANGHLLILINGVYGERISKIASVHKILQTRMVFPENQIPDPLKVRQMLEQDPTITHVAMIHCETTTGIINHISTISYLLPINASKAFRASLL
jgi:2-aminoethylphosphonate-pyruvate transaminase